MSLFSELAHLQASSASHPSSLLHSFRFSRVHRENYLPIQPSSILMFTCPCLSASPARLYQLPSSISEKAMALHSSTLAWKIPWMEEPGRLQSMGSQSRTQLSDFPFTFHFHALEKEMATHSSVLAWRIPGMGEPGGLPSMGSHRVGHDWSDLTAAAAAAASSIYSVIQKFADLASPLGSLY